MTSRPIGLIARIEHMLERMPQDRQEQERKAERGRAAPCSAIRTASASPSPCKPSWTARRRELAALEADLAATARQGQAKAA